MKLTKWDIMEALGIEYDGLKTMPADWDADDSMVVHVFSTTYLNAPLKVNAYHSEERAKEIASTYIIEQLLRIAIPDTTL